jgi:hypothetical protein
MRICDRHIKHALRLLPVALVCALLPGVAFAETTATPPLVPGAEYNFPFHAANEGSDCFNPTGGPCSTTVRLKANASGTQLQAWDFVGFAHNASCKKHHAWQGAESSAPAAANERINIGASGQIHFLAPHSTKKLGVEVTATVLDNGKTITGWFEIHSRVSGRQCDTGRAKFTASTNEERE